jgi:nucleoside-diphosphate-sugar epimerase
VRESTADITLAREQLGYEPDVDLATGLSRTVEWISERWSHQAQSAAG